MASSAERMAQGMSFGAFSKASELKKRIWFTLAALVVYRLGTYIPLPGIDPVILAEIFQRPRVVFWACSTCSPVARWGE